MCGRGYLVRYLVRYLFILLHKRHNENVLFAGFIQSYHPLAWYLHPTAHIRSLQRKLFVRSIFA